MNRREFIEIIARSGATLTGVGAVIGLAGCGVEEGNRTPPPGAPRFAVAKTVTLYDVYAQALYMDGGLGPKTGIIKVDYILAGKPVDLEFWHGHGGKAHRYQLTPEHYAQLKQLKRVYLTTTAVDGHTHRLFIEPVDPKWRVPGAKPVEVPVDE